MCSRCAYLAAGTSERRRDDSEVASYAQSACSALDVLSALVGCFTCLLECLPAAQGCQRCDDDHPCAEVTVQSGKRASLCRFTSFQTGKCSVATRRFQQRKCLPRSHKSGSCETANGLSLRAVSKPLHLCASPTAAAGAPCGRDGRLWHDLRLAHARRAHLQAHRVRDAEPSKARRAYIMHYVVLDVECIRNCLTPLSKYVKHFLKHFDTI